MYIIIPAYEPDQRLVQVVQDIKEELQADIIVVNDGSDASYDTFYHQVEQLGATVLIHPNNLGKGAALKTAFTHIQNVSVNSDIMITVDSDGQHLIKDIVKVARTTQHHPESIVLGARAFVGKVPARSHFGNKVTAQLFRLVTGVAITDTQTGLRGLSTELIPWLLSLKGERFEYEFNMLLEADRSGHDIHEVPIETVYIEGNESSHFRPIQDSIRIYSPFLKFSGASILAAIVDALALFTLVALTKNLLISVILARLISATTQCLLNANLVFNRSNPLLISIVRYFLLVAVILTCNYFMLKVLISIGLGLILSKLLTETILFILSYRVQRKFVFN